MVYTYPFMVYLGMVDIASPTFYEDLFHSIHLNTSVAAAQVGK
jgi:hypothetical protein